MPEPPNSADSDREGFTCSVLLMWCLYPPGRSTKKKPEEEEEASTSRPQVETERTPDQPMQVPSHAASLEKLEYASLHSGNNIVFDFVAAETEQAPAGAPAFHGYCPSPCFDLPVELIRACERYGAVAAACDTPVTAAFVFGDYQGAALKKMASCLASGAEGKEAPHLVRFLSALDPSVPRHPVAVDGDHCEFADGAWAQRQPAGFPERETVP